MRGSSSFRAPLYRDNGRICGSFVYMLLCRDRGPIHVKVGMADSPYNRFLSLRKDCPATPRRFCSFEVTSRNKAREVESDLLAALKKWIDHGEWLVVDPVEKDDFNAAWKVALIPHRSPAWPCVWDQVSAAALIRYAEQRQRYHRKRWTESPLAYRDFEKDSRAVA
jgi:T5orf172 domain